MIVFELSLVHTVDNLRIRSSPLVTVCVSVFSIHVLLFVDHVPHLLEPIADLFVIFLDNLNLEIEFLLTSVGLNETNFLFESFRNSLWINDKITVFIVCLQIEVIICVIIVVNCFDVFGYFSSGRLQANQSVLTELF